MRWRFTSPNAIGLLILFGLNASLLANMVSQVRSSDMPAVDEVDWSANLPSLKTNTANRTPIEGYSQILTRPVFFRSREPFVPAPRPAQTPLVAPTVINPGLTVGGIMIKNDLSKAYLLGSAGSGGAWTAEGETFQGWKVRSIDKTGVKLEQAGRSIDLQLYPGNK